MAKKPESRLQRRIRDRLEKEVGGYWVKIWVGPFQNAGIPDLIGCVSGLFFALEVKCPGLGKRSEASEIQAHTMRQIKKRGGGYCNVVTSPEEAVAFVRKCLSKTRPPSKTRR